MYAGTSGMKLENYKVNGRTIMNKSIMMGRVVNEPDLRYTQTENGELAIANFRLAVNRKFVRRGDPEADFFSCTAFWPKSRVRGKISV